MFSYRRVLHKLDVFLTNLRAGSASTPAAGVEKGRKRRHLGEEHAADNDDRRAADRAKTEDPDRATGRAAGRGGVDRVRDLRDRDEQVLAVDVLPRRRWGVVDEHRPV